MICDPMRDRNSNACNLLPFSCDPHTCFLPSFSLNISYPKYFQCFRDCIFQELYILPNSEGSLMERNYRISHQLSRSVVSCISSSLDLDDWEFLQQDVFLMARSTKRNDMAMFNHYQGILNLSAQL